jgi:hypothetical protein
MRALQNTLMLLGVAALAIGCSKSDKTNGGGGTVSGSNAIAIQVNLGPNSPSSDYVNGAFTSVTVCTPGTSTCETVDNVLVDTGSYGLRLIGSTFNSSLLPTQSNGSGQTGECTLFADNSYTWGTVAIADIELGGEVAHSVPVNLINSTFPVPSGCSAGAGGTSGAPTNDNSVLLLGAKGILGVGPFQPDCGSSCAASATSDANSNPSYWSCTSSICVAAAEPVASQVQNPVALFATDNNGVIMELPAISGNGASTVNGSLVFGIGTESNNQIGSSLIVYANSSTADFTTSFNGTALSQSFIDSGSNGLYFNDSSLPQCGSSSAAPGFYCPSSTQNFNATMIGTNNGQVDVAFSIVNAVNLLSSSNDAAYNDIGGVTGSLINDSFDWGLPFFYGLNVYFAIDGKSTPSGDGPYYAF